jgi:transcriptional regulator GlxA family with amidase domain
MYGIFIYDGVEPIDLGATIGVLSMARRIAPDLTFASVALKAGEVVCASGMRVMADFGISDAPGFDDLIVTGGPGWVEAAKDAETIEYLRRSSARLSSICTGAMILEAAGLLESRTVTTKSKVFDGETAPIDLLSSPAKTLEAAVVDDAGLVTGGGVTLGIDTMFYCLARSHGAKVAEETARVMEYSRALTANRDALGYVTTGASVR